MRILCHLATVLLSFVMAFMPVAIAAQAFPARPVRLVVPYLAGGGPDAFTRIVADRLAKIWNQPVIVDNKPGASGAVGAQTVKTAAPDGYTLLVIASGLVQLPHLVAHPGYDALNDFAPIAWMGGTHLALIVNSSLPVRSVGEFIAYAKTRPDKLNYASQGAGSLSNMFGEVFNDAAGVRLTHVAYKGDSPALMDLLENRVESAFLSVFLVRPYIAAGRVKVLAVTGKTRSPLVADVPTFEEAGVKGMDAQGWTGMFAPSGTPVDIQNKISADVRSVLAQPEVQAKALEIGWIVAKASKEEFARTVRSDYSMYGETFKKYRITLN